MFLREFAESLALDDPARLPQGHPDQHDFGGRVSEVVTDSLTVTPKTALRQRIHAKSNAVERDRYCVVPTL
ncbi:MAG: hypothetical protein JWR37_2565 [Mycobacterium sp.]|nr:hypothetical protein [Mycobacterium sp.]